MSKKLDPVILGMLKFARWDDIRERGGRALGGATRREIDVSPADLPARGEGPAEEIAAREERRLQYRLILQKLHAHTKNRQHRRLLVRRLLRGESITAIAKSLGLTDTNARTVVMRAKKHLGLKKT